MTAQSLPSADSDFSRGAGPAGPLLAAPRLSRLDAAVLGWLAGVGWFLLGREKPVEDETASTVALGGGSGSTSVLDASGYVVARRMATVSAKVTGKVQEVLIE